MEGESRKNLHHERLMYEWGLRSFGEDLKIRTGAEYESQKRKKPTQKGSRLFRFLKGNKKEDTMTV